MSQDMKAKFSSIGTILDGGPRETPVRRQTEAAEPQPPPAAAAVAKPAGSGRQPARPRSAASTGGVRTLPFRAPRETVEALRARAHRDRTSQPNIILDAIEANLDQLGELVAGQEPDTRRDGMFRRLTPTPSRDTIPVTVRITAQALETIDQLVRDHNAPSRTALIVAALNAYLA